MSPPPPQPPPATSRPAPHGTPVSTTAATGEGARAQPPASRWLAPLQRRSWAPPPPGPSSGLSGPRLAGFPVWWEGEREWQQPRLLSRAWALDGGGAEFSRNDGVGIALLLPGAFRLGILQQSLVLGGPGGELEARTERKESLEITLPKPVWFHVDVKVVLLLEEKGGPEILQ